MPEQTVDQATHWLRCRHVCNWVKEYDMPCIFLKMTRGGNAKVRVFGDRHRGRRDLSRIRYVDPNRIRPMEASRHE